MLLGSAIICARTCCGLFNAADDAVWADGWWMVVGQVWQWRMTVMVSKWNTVAVIRGDDDDKRGKVRALPRYSVNGEVMVDLCSL